MQINKVEVKMHKVIERKTFCKILVPIYESRTSSDKAVEYAIKISQDYDAQLVILNVIRSDTNLHNVSVPSHVIGMKEQAQAYFVKITEKIHEDRNKENVLRIKTEIVASVKPADAIVSYAKDKDIDLIVLETRTSSKFKGILVGNIESYVVRFAHCAVLTVK
ncbi:MAG TPA: universal stress protein [Nitrososphaeraceae archaeon]|jgi:nucleotide-binding universal stress UspA family protein|nr:universal stress protein [Nitrososphaeraceae archaeon]